MCSSDLAGALGGQAINIEYINASKESLGIADLDVSSYDNAGKSLERFRMRFRLQDSGEMISVRHRKSWSMRCEVLS